jgi:hypothetical protein
MRRGNGSKAMMRKAGTLIAIVSAIGVFGGCASEQTKTVRATTTTTDPAQPPATTTTTAETTTSKEPDSLLGATAHAIAN